MSECFHSKKLDLRSVKAITISRQMPDRLHRQAPEQYTNARLIRDR